MNAFINEFHYDNASGDVGEFVEVAGPAGTDLTGFSIVLYNGNGGASYATIALSGTIPNLSNGFGVLSFAAAGLQNGSPDGIALVGADGAVIEFLSYEGVFTAVGGPADGMTSTDVGVAEPGDAPIGVSLQRQGTGDEAADFAFAGPLAETPGAVNTGQVFEAPDGGGDGEDGVFTLELLHFTDQEASTGAIVDAPNLSAVLAALRLQDIGADGEPDNTLTLSSGDAFIPGVFFAASQAIFGTPGIADFQIQNELGVQAMALGNHEFDSGPALLASLISGSATGNFTAAFFDGTALDDLEYAGTAFPYLSSNLDFAPNANLAPLEVPGGGAPVGGTVTSSVVIDVNGEPVGVVGATTPTLGSISSPGNVGIFPTPFGSFPSPEEVAALAEIIQAEVDALLAANPELNKVILLAHMQRIDIEFQLAQLLENVDIIVAGGSNTRLFDADDRIRAGDSNQGVYPQFFENAGGTTTAVVNTDGSYKYVGRLVIDFDEAGNVIAESYDEEVSGAFATDAQGVADLGAEALIDPEVQAIADAVEAQILATESNVFGISDVFLNGNRAGTNDPANTDGVRTQETNLGNLTADANLDYAKEVDPTVLISLKNGGGIRASIGQTVVLPGDTSASRLPNPELADGDGTVFKPAGGISQNDIQTALAFNNGLALVTLTKTEIVALLEHGARSVGAGAFPQIGGVKFAFDPLRPAGDRITSAGIFDEDGSLLFELVRNGEIAGDPNQEFRMVTLGFLVAGGDGYPFPNLNTDPTRGPVGDPEVIARVNLVNLVEPGVRDGAATFADEGTEQDAFAEFLAENHATPETAFDVADEGRVTDARIQSLAFRADEVFVAAAPEATEELGEITVAAVLDSGAGEAGSEVAAVEDGRVYVTNGATGAIDVFDAATGALLGSVDLTFLPGFDSLQSVAVANGIVAVAVATVDILDDGAVIGRNGFVALIDAETLQVFDRVTVGVLPDSIAFTPDGTKLVVANEGEFNGDSSVTVDPAGSISIVDLSDPIDPKVTTIGFDGLETLALEAGVRLAPGAGLESIEPEYVSISPDGTQAFVTLQEANAVAVVDLATATIVNILGAGVVDHSLPGNELDANDDGLIALRTHADLVGIRMPDTIATAEIGGQLFFLTANEGDGRDFDEARVGDVIDGEIAGLSIDPSVITEGLERLVIDITSGDTDGDGDIDVLHAFGSRSFTIFDASGAVVFDSGSEFERIIADIAPERFNNDDGELIGPDLESDNRSDAKGPEPEALAVGVIGDQTYAFIGLERDSGVVIYNITTPGSAFFVDYIDGFAGGHVSPETIVFISAEESANGAPQIAVAYEVSGTTVIYNLGEVPDVVDGPILNETFDYAELGEAPGFTLSDVNGAAIEFFGEATSFDYFGVFDGEGDGGADFGGDPQPTSFNAYAGFDDNYLAASDIDSGDPAISDPAFVTWSGLDISGLDFVSLSADLATLDSDNGLDPTDFVAFEISVDGGEFIRVLAFETADGDTSNQPTFLLDTDFDGIGDGAALTSAFQTFSTTFAVEGETLDLRLAIRIDAGFEDIGVDNVVLDAAEPPAAEFDLQVSEIWFGQDGLDVTADWFEITNFGPDAWTASIDGALFYDDNSFDPVVADLIQGIGSIGAGESVIVVIGQQADADAFLAVWGDDGLPEGTQIGFTDGAGLGQGGDAVSLFLDAEGDGLAADQTPFEMEEFPDAVAAAASGQSWEVATQQFSTLEDFEDTVATTELGGANVPADEPAIGSPGFIPTPAEEVEFTLISAIQGSSDFSGLDGFAKVGVHDRAALEGQIVTIEAIVTADFQGGTGLGGFFVQEEDADADGDAFTSEGIFIFGGPTDVAVGDLVRITGTVQEFFGQTQIGASAVEIVASNQTLPTATVVDLGATGVMLDDDAATDYVVNLEFVEGMLVTFPETVTLNELFNLDRFGEYRVSSEGRPEQFTQSNAPSVEGFDAHLQDVAARGLVLDDGSSVQNPFTLEIIDGNDGVLTASDSFRMGDTLTNLTGVVAYSFDEFRINDGTAEYSEQNPRPAAPDEVGGNFKVASLNVLNYFTTLDTNPGSFNGPNTSGPNDTLEPRGANSTLELDRQAQKTVNAIVAMDADVLGLVELENDDDIAIADLVGRVNAELGSEVYAFIATGDVGTDAITTGIIYKIATVEPIGGPAILFEFEGRSFTDPLGAGSQQNRPAVAQTFRHIETGETMTVAVNHLKSKGSGTGVAADEDQRDGQGLANATRTAAAEILADWLASDPTGQGSENQLIVGDLNANAEEDPIRALEAAGFVDVAGALLGDAAYSFVFDGQTGTLDYVLANGPAFDKVTGATEWHVNADEADAIDFNIDIVAGVTRDPTLFDGETPARNSDHDPVIVGFALEPARVVREGGEGRDLFIAEAGVAEDFVFGDLDRDQTRGFDAAEDRFDLRAWGVQSFGELSITERAGPGGTTLLGIADAASGNLAFNIGTTGAADLTEDNFVFAAVQDLVVTGVRASGAETIFGRAGDDRLIGDTGYNLMLGRGGADTFEIGLTRGDVVGDFTDGVDVVDLSAWGAGGFDQLRLTETATQIAVRDGNGNLVRIDKQGGLQLADLSGDDFIFADPLSA